MTEGANCQQGLGEVITYKFQRRRQNLFKYKIKDYFQASDLEATRHKENNNIKAFLNYIIK